MTSKVIESHLRVLTKYNFTKTPQDYNFEPLIYVLKRTVSK
jgi:hypothetical protein